MHENSPAWSILGMQSCENEKTATTPPLHLLCPAALSGAVLERAGEAAVEGGEAGFSESRLARALGHTLVIGLADEPEGSDNGDEC